MSSADQALPAPGLGRRLAALIYEGLLLFGILMAAGWLYGGLTQQRHALEGRLGLQLFLFLVLAVYFVWFWTHGGQTVALKAWRLRVVAANGLPLTQTRALARYLCSWLWFLPSLLAVQLAGLHGGAAIGTTLIAGALTYAATSFLHPQRQFLHDALCGTRIVDVARAQGAT
jgi:uncharacterized RDD family membrane protein YckC